MYDPQGNDNNREFVEIYTTTFLNLSGYIVGDAVSNDTLLAVSHSPGSFSLIVEEGFNATGINASIYSVGPTIGNNLNNDKDTVNFYFPNGTLIDTMNYNSSMGGSSNNRSLERNASGSFTESLIVNGTPGQRNSVIPVCTISLVNSSWSGWANQTECQQNDTRRQNRSLIQYDENYCGTFDNITFWDYQDNGCYFGFAGDITSINSTLSNLTLMKSNGTVTFLDSGFPLFYFSFNFTNTTFAFADILIQPQPGDASPGYLLVVGIDLTKYNQTKHFYLRKIDSASNAVCILDAEVGNISALSLGCTRQNETIVRCDSAIHANYTCTGNGTHYTVSGLHHSAVREFTMVDETSPSESSTAGGGGGGGSSCPVGMKLVGRKCVTAEVPKKPSEVPSIPRAVSSEEISPIEEVVASPHVVEKDIELRLLDGKLVPRKTIIENNGITGAAVGVIDDSISSGGMVPLVAVTLLVIFSCAAAWLVSKKK